MQAADAGGGDGRGVGGSDGRQRWTADGIAEGGKAGKRKQAGWRWWRRREWRRWWQRREREAAMAATAAASEASASLLRTSLRVVSSWRVRFRGMTVCARCYILLDNNTRRCYLQFYLSTQKLIAVACSLAREIRKSGAATGVGGASSDFHISDFHVPCIPGVTNSTVTRRTLR